MLTWLGNKIILSTQHSTKHFTNLSFANCILQETLHIHSFYFLYLATIIIYHHHRICQRGNLALLGLLEKSLKFNSSFRPYFFNAYFLSERKLCRTDTAHKLHIEQCMNRIELQNQPLFSSCLFSCSKISTYRF